MASDAESNYFSKYENLLALENSHKTNMTKHYAPDIPFIKDTYLDPEQLKAAVFESARVQKIIDEISKNDPKKRKEVSDDVRDIINEIGFGHNLTIIRVLGMVITSVIKKTLTAGLHVNKFNIGVVKSDFGSQPVLYLPSHRSYADFILMSYVCFCYDIVIPGIAAGMDFHAMVGMGNMMRKTGAFFMRRSFVNDMKYWYIFKEYMRSLMKLYHTGAEFFVEGTRSRSCKALAPKIGLLSMALEPFFMGEIPDVQIVPISVTYEKPLEEQLFVYELMGVPKPKESTLGLFKALSIVNQDYGEIYFEFGLPFTVKEYFGDKLNRWKHAINPAHVQNLAKDELEMITDLAYDVVRLQQDKIFITTFNLVTVYYNYKKYSGESITLEGLVDGISWMNKIFKDLGAILTIERQGCSDDIELVRRNVLKALKLHSNVLTVSKRNVIEIGRTNCDFSNVDKSKLKGYNLSEETMKLSVPIFTLQLYNNPCLHWLANPALLILTSKYLSNDGEKPIPIEDFQKFVSCLRKLFSNEFVLYQKLDETEFKKALEHLVRYNILKIDKNNVIFNSQNESANLYLSAISPFICCYLQTASTIIEEFSGKSFKEKDLLSKTQENVEKQILQFKQNVHPYCLCLDSINIAIQTFVNLKALTKKRDDNNDSMYSAEEKLVREIHDKLSNLCRLLTFNYLTFQSDVSSKL